MRLFVDELKNPLKLMTLSLFSKVNCVPSSVKKKVEIKVHINWNKIYFFEVLCV